MAVALRKRTESTWLLISLREPGIYSSEVYWGKMIWSKKQRLLQWRFITWINLQRKLASSFFRSKLFESCWMRPIFFVWDFLWLSCHAIGNLQLAAGKLNFTSCILQANLCTSGNRTTLKNTRARTHARTHTHTHTHTHSMNLLILSYFPDISLGYMVKNKT